MSLELLTLGQREWYLQTVRYFAVLDFFAEYTVQQSAEMAEQVAHRVTRQWDEPMPVDPAKEPQQADMYLLSVDDARVWYRDLECVARGADAYVDTLLAWAAISRGAFRPEGITETWRDDEGPVDVGFTFRSRRHRFVHPDGRGDFLDLRLRHLLNDLIADTGLRFEICDNLGMPSFVLVLTSGERARLERERGWEFYDH